MTDLIVLSQTNPWYRLKAPVLDGVSSPITKRVYNPGLDEFFARLSGKQPFRRAADQPERAMERA